MALKGMQRPDRAEPPTRSIGGRRSYPSMTAFCEQLRAIIANEQLSPVFQPIIDMRQGTIIGYEGLIRGPSDSPLHSPLTLFQSAEACQCLMELEHLCRRVTLARYAELKLPGKLFLNVSPDCLTDPDYKTGETLNILHRYGLSPTQIIIEITESQPSFDYGLLREAVSHYRNMGFRIAIDDLGEGFASLRLWSELRPDFVKVDKHFVQNIHQDPVKQQFLRSIQQIAENAHSEVIAEGIETEAELLVIRALGIAYGQGYYIARPNGLPRVTLPGEIHAVLTREENGGKSFIPTQRRFTAETLMVPVTPVNPRTLNKMVYQRFADDAQLHALPVVSDGLPLGLLKRHQVLESFAKPFNRELYGKKDCTLLMDKRPMIVDKHISLQELSRLVASAERHYLTDGFIITDQGRYLGMGSGHDLMRELTNLQLHAARYANPLTLLPGNVPINEQIDYLLACGTHFTAAYFDLDYFKPFNDCYGYRRGDDVIQLLGQLLNRITCPERDFVGHIGGDDFIVLFQSADWQARCERVLDEFDEAIQTFFSAEHREAGGYCTENRRGDKEFHPLLSLSIGALKVEPERYPSHHEISAAAADAKKQAKKILGSALFIERRLPESQDRVMPLRQVL